MTFVPSVWTDKTIKLWKITERDKRPEGYNLKDEEGKLKDLSTVTSLQVSGRKSWRQVASEDVGLVGLLGSEAHSGPDPG